MLSFLCPWLASEGTLGSPRNTALTNKQAYTQTHTHTHKHTQTQTHRQPTNLFSLILLSSWWHGIQDNWNQPTLSSSHLSISCFRGRCWEDQWSQSDSSEQSENAYWLAGCYRGNGLPSNVETRQQWVTSFMFPLDVNRTVNRTVLQLFCNTENLKAGV